MRISLLNFCLKDRLYPHVLTDHHPARHFHFLQFFLRNSNNKQLMKKMTIILPIFIIILSHFPSRNSAATPVVPALYVFGDSLVDNGNNNLLPTLVKANFQPYGMDFEQGATGRFTNGKTVADFIADYLGLPYSPPYLSIMRAVLRPDQLTGLNFASGSCGILPETGSDLGRCLNFPEQVNFFERIVRNDLPVHYKNPEELSNYLSKSLYLISIGSNDYIVNYVDSENYHSSRRYTPESFAQLLVQHLSLQLQRLYYLGARKVIVFEVGPLGCIPSLSTEFKHSGRCNEDINQLAVLFNNQLYPMLQSLTSMLNGSDFILGHVYPLGYDAIVNPSNHGLIDSSNPCCVTWLNGTATCIPEIAPLACTNARGYYFWDGYHLTETIYDNVASLCFNGSSICVPKNIQDLVSQL